MEAGESSWNSEEVTFVPDEIRNGRTSDPERLDGHSGVWKSSLRIYQFDVQEYNGSSLKPQVAVTAPSSWFSYDPRNHHQRPSSSADEIRSQPFQDSAGFERTMSCRSLAARMLARIGSGDPDESRIRRASDAGIRRIAGTFKPRGWSMDDSRGSLRRSLWFTVISAFPYGGTADRSGLRVPITRRE